MTTRLCGSRPAFRSGQGKRCTKTSFPSVVRSLRIRFRDPGVIPDEHLENSNMFEQLYLWKAWITAASVEDCSNIIRKYGLKEFILSDRKLPCLFATGNSTSFSARLCWSMSAPGKISVFSVRMSSGRGQCVSDDTELLVSRGNAYFYPLSASAPLAMVSEDSFHDPKRFLAGHQKPECAGKAGCTDDV